MNKNDIIHGKSVILIPLAQYEMPLFIKLHMEDKDCNMGRYCLKDYNIQQSEHYIVSELNSGKLFVWSVYTKEEIPQLVGFIYLNDVNAYHASVHGIKSDTFEEVKKEMSCAEDALRALVKFCFDKGIERIETDVCKSNKLAVALDKKVGFVVEGELRKAVVKDNGYDNLILLSILKEEYRGKREDAVLHTTATA